MTTYYHSTRSPLVLRDAPLCVTDEAEASAAYLDGEAGYRYEVRLPAGVRLADDADVRRVVLAIDPETPYTRTWEWLEEYRGVIPALVAAGYDGVRYADRGPDEAVEHGTVMLFSGARAEVVGVEEVGA